jgi:hypothetical protein
LETNFPDFRFWFGKQINDSIFSNDNKNNIIFFTVSSCCRQPFFFFFVFLFFCFRSHFIVPKVGSKLTVLSCRIKLKCNSTAMILLWSESVVTLYTYFQRNWHSKSMFYPFLEREKRGKMCFKNIVLTRLGRCNSKISNHTHTCTEGYQLLRSWQQKPQVSFGFFVCLILFPLSSLRQGYML